jgi:methylenetetrahydrofolate dehydrogenase (NADP+) / methenyltetrahydrofolate cyclohydrolase
MPFIDCEKIANNILSTVKGGSLAIISNRDDPSASSYSRQLIKTAGKVGIDIIEEDFSSQWLSDGVIRLIQKHNDSEVNGILVISPSQHHLVALDYITPEKRVEGVDFADNPQRVSCTARACVEIIASQTPILGKNCLIVGYGKNVGKPVAYLLMRRHAGSVTLTHRYTKQDDLFLKHMKEADIIISGVGIPHFVRGDFKDKIIIDAGISVIEGRLKGDVDPMLAVSNDITPVPGGVGPVTTALLFQNVAMAAEGKF